MGNTLRLSTNFGRNIIEKANDSGNKCMQQCAGKRLLTTYYKYTSHYDKMMHLNGSLPLSITILLHET